MRLRWRPSTSCVGALALLAFLALTAFKLVAGPLLTAYADATLRIEHSQALLSRYRALSAQRPRLSTQLEAMERLVAASTAYLKLGPSDTLAGPALQNHVRNIVEAVGGVLRSSQILPLEPIESNVSVSRVGLVLQIRVAVEGFQDMLYNLETAQPSLFIKEITIIGGKAGRLGEGAGANPPLDVRMEVYGLWET